jgi:hypothetical protein
MMARIQVALDPEEHRRAIARARELGISFAAYVRRVIAADLAGPERTSDPSILFDLGDGGPGDVAREKDRYVGDAVAAGRGER